MPQQQMSSMQKYMQDYGARLQSMLAGGTTPQQARMQPETPFQSQNQMGPTSALDPAAQPGPAPGGAPAGAAPSEGGVSFKNQWEKSSPAQKKDFTDGLDKQLRQGNQTIDSAYDDLVKQMGTRPAAEADVSREEKGMMLMQFGLSLMANSSSKAYGEDLGAAVGASGGSVLEGHLARRRGKQDQYDANRLNIESARAQSKVHYAETSALEASRDDREMSRDARREAREDSQIAGIVTQPDDTVVGYTRGGQVSALEKPGGGAVKSKPKPPPGAGGLGGRGFESDRRYQLYLETYGKDAHGQPLTGPAMEDVKKRALAFSADPKASTLSDSEMRSMAEKSADAFQKSNWMQFRDMTADQIQTWRNKNAQENFERLKRGEELSLTPPSNPKPAPGRGSAPKSDFKTMDEANAAIAAGTVHDGDIISVGGKRFRAQK